MRPVAEDPTPAAPDGSEAESVARGPITLALDIGGTGIKGDTLDRTGQPTQERVRVPTPYPLPPELLVSTLAELAVKLGQFDRVSIGFPGVVRAGVVLSAPHFVRTGGDGTPLDPELERKWRRFDLQAAVEKVVGRPTRVANDAEVQGMAVISGQGLEVVLTLGTGLGSAIFHDGHLAPHLELAHHPLHKDRTYNEDVGEPALAKIGRKRWNKRVRRMVEVVHQLVFFDHLYIGGGNSQHLDADLGPDVTVVDNSAGILGGIKLWELPDGAGASSR